MKAFPSTCRRLGSRLAWQPPSGVCSQQRVCSQSRQQSQPKPTVAALTEEVLEGCVGRIEGARREDSVSLPATDSGFQSNNALGRRVWCMRGGGSPVPHQDLSLVRCALRGGERQQAEGRAHSPLRPQPSAFAASKTTFLSHAQHVTTSKRLSESSRVVGAGRTGIGTLTPLPQVRPLAEQA